MKKLLFIAVILPQILWAQKDFISPEIKPMVDYIKQCNTSPVDYVLGLFDKYDVVVLGERDHMDTTQYELVRQITSDPRFIEKVGHVFTEIGCYNMAGQLTGVVEGTYAHDSLFDKALAQVLFDFDYMPVWEKTNYTQLCRNIYRINKTLPANRKISLTPTDISYSWEQTQGMTGKEFATFFKVWEEKDLIMGHNAINELYRIFNGNESRKKVLMIYNAPHSCRYYKNADYGKFFAYQIIADRFPGRVANVAINWAVVDNEEGYTSLSNHGKIDAAFTVCGNKSIGFDLNGSPLGEYNYNCSSPQPQNPIPFQNVYHGFIFYKPVTEWVDCVGVPNLDKIDCKEELARRCGLWNNEDYNSQEYKEEKYEYYTKLRCFPVTLFFDEKIINEQISRYYKPHSPTKKQQ